MAEKQHREIKQLELSLKMNGMIIGDGDGISLGASSDTSSNTVDSKRHVERSLKRRTRQLLSDTKAIRTLGIVMVR